MPKQKTRANTILKEKRPSIILGGKVFFIGSGATPGIPGKAKGDEILKTIEAFGELGIKYPGLLDDSPAI